MKTIILGLSLLIATTAFCQKNQIQVLSNERTLGKSLNDNSVIDGKEYVF